MKKTIKINTDNLDSAAPLYFQYDGQCQTQPAYIEIDPRGDEITVSADYDGNIGGGCPALHWHNLVTTIPVPAGVLGSALIAHMESDDFRADVLELCADFEEYHNGSNYVGRWGEDSRDLEQGMEYAMRDIENAEIYDGDFWLNDDIDFLDENGDPCAYAYESVSAKYDGIDIKTENLSALVAAAEKYIDETCQVVTGLKSAFESIIEDME